MKKICRSLAAMTAAAVMTSTAAMQLSSFAADEAAEQTPVFGYFNKNDVNGRVLIQLPEGATAVAEITFDSPEGLAEPYYNSELAENGTYSFPIEGRDNTPDDYRSYNLIVTVTGGEYGVTSSPYLDTFTVPDGNDNPDSFTELSYVFTIDDAESDNEWDVYTDADTGIKTIALHLDAIMKGDIDGNRKVDSSDASSVLAEYASLSTVGISTFNGRQKKAADVNNDNMINSADASSILAYYAAVSTGGNPSWD